jgi:hypothetical protein
VPAEIHLGTFQMPSRSVHAADNWAGSQQTHYRFCNFEICQTPSASDTILTPKAPRRFAFGGPKPEAMIPLRRAWKYPNMKFH